MKKVFMACALILSLCFIGGCSKDDDEAGSGSSKVKGNVEIDGKKFDVKYGYKISDESGATYSFYDKDLMKYAGQENPNVEFSAIIFFSYENEPDIIEMVGIAYKTNPYNDKGYGYDDDEIFDEINTGSHQIEIGLGVGPSVTVAPFAQMSNQLKNLRASLYFHVVPSFSGVLMDNGDGDMKLNYGFVPFLKFGGCINWKALSIFAEGRWGSANYKMASTADVEDPDTDEIISFDKWSMKTSSVRFGIGISF